MLCSGYRDTQQIRIENESRSVAERALRNTPSFKSQSLALSVDLQARDVFFAYYVTGNTRCWTFLQPYYHPTNSPHHLTLAMEAVGLAYLWHQVHSETALANARQRYISALRMTNQILTSPTEASKETTLLASLLLDLFEKITATEPGNRSWISHVNGALSLVKLRGVENFQDPSELRILVRLATHYTISCIAGSTPVPDEIRTLQKYLRDHPNVESQTMRLFDVLAQYACLRSEVYRKQSSHNEYIAASTKLDAELQALCLEMPSSWQYSTTQLSQKSDRAFDLYFDSYPHPNICQAWNILRVVRILLKESLIEHCSASPPHNLYLTLMREAQNDVETLAGEVCACVPQYLDCNGAARQRVSASWDPPPCIVAAGHSHTPFHRAACHSLIFSLYTVGRSKAIQSVRPWVTEQLHFMGSHFYIRNAEVVAQILEQGVDLSPWEVYGMLGSYAFNA